MEVSVIIVNWKVKDLLRRCLDSLYRETKDASFEVIVIDNDSRDGSVEMVAREFPKVTVIANNVNTGFAAACNAGICLARGEYILLLNPDTELQEDAIGRMVAWMRAHPEAAIMGPRIANADGSTQESVSRFPTFLSQALISLKMHNVIPQFPSLKRYFAVDHDYSSASCVDQVKGAAFLIRRSAMEKIGLLDEKFFVWYEEVDWCKRAHDAGLQTWYAPVATVVHHGGASFGQVFGPARQRMLNKSMRWYMRKHHGLTAYLGLLALHPLSMFAAYIAVPFKNARYSVASNPYGAAKKKDGFGIWYLRAFLYYVLFEVISLYGFLLPQFSTAAFFVIVLGTAVIAWKRFDLAFLVLLAELFVGSQGGYMVSYVGDGLFVSLRLGLFLVIFGTWLAKSLLGLLSSSAQSRLAHPDLAWLAMLRKSRLLWPYVTLLAVFAFGAIRGIMLGNGFGEVFFDANAYAYYALLPACFMAFGGSSAGAKALPLRATATLFAAVTDSVAKALVVEFFFAHRQFFIAWNLYIWVRDTRVGEITIMIADFYRIFFQSQIWALGLIIAGAIYAAYAPSWRDGRIRGVLVMVAWSMTAMVLSLSRSFWFGGAVAAFICVVMLASVRAERRIWSRLALIGISSVLTSIIVIFALYASPWPSKTGELSISDLLGSRATSFGDAAASSRWALLPKLVKAGMEHPLLGNGFGKTVTYTTSDPRLLKDNPTGEYTTSAFEWGYHDLWVKLGFLGLAAYAWFLWRLLIPLARTVRAGRASLAHVGAASEAVYALGGIGAVAALLATNLFSPYLNHPLGIGMLMLVAAYGSLGYSMKT